MKRLLLFCWLLALAPAPRCRPAGVAVATPVPDSFADPAMETRARALQRQFRCLVCQGESIDESRAERAGDLRHLVRQQMAEGKSDDQIKTYLVARYGNFILMDPPMEPDTYVLWLAPFAVLIGAGVIAIVVIRRARESSI